MTPHIHVKEIHAFAEGDEIEIEDVQSIWVDCPNPTWSVEEKYRIKPKPPIVRYVNVGLNMYANEVRCWGWIHSEANVKFTFDGVTGAFMDVEKI